MRWQNPWAWLGLLSLVLPVLVHLFTRQRARSEAFPSLRFIDVSRLLPTRSTRLNDLPLLAVRITILALAVAALAQPLWRTDAREHTASAARARVVIVDTSEFDGSGRDRTRAPTDAPDTTRLRVLADSLSQRDAPTSVSRVSTGAPSGQLAGAVAWLEARTGTRDIVVISAFRDGSLDAPDVAAIPADIGLTLHRVPVASLGEVGARVAQTSVRDAVVWAAGPVDAGRLTQPTRTDVAPVSAIVAAARDAGAALLADSIDASTERALVVASPGADSLAAWTSAAAAWQEAWMGDVLVAMQRDTVLATALSALGEPADTVISAPAVVVRRAAGGAPVVVASALPNRGATARMLLMVRAPAAHLVTASVLLAASRALSTADTRSSMLAVTSSTASSTSSTTAATAAESSASAAALSAAMSVGPSGAMLPDSLLRAWERAASAEPRTDGPRSGSGDDEGGSSDARWLWLLVLVLLGVEAWMRRPRTAASLAATPGGRTTTGGAA